MNNNMNNNINNTYLKGTINKIIISKIDKFHPFYIDNLAFESVYWDNGKIRIIKIPILSAYDENKTFDKYYNWINNPCNYCKNIIKKNSIDHTALICPYYQCKNCYKFGHNYYACDSYKSKY